MGEQKFDEIGLANGESVVIMSTSTWSRDEDCEHTAKDYLA